MASGPDRQIKCEWQQGKSRHFHGWRLLPSPPGKFIKTATPVKHNRAKRRGPRRPCGAEPAGDGPVRPGQSPLGIETDDTGQLANDMKKRRGGAGRLWEGAQK